MKTYMESLPKPVGMLRLVKLRCRAHCYVTEEIEKVKKAVETVLGDAKFSVRTFQLEGHYGDPIKVLEYNVDDEADVSKVFKKVITKIGLESVGVEERSGATGRFHIRLDKQKAYIGEISAEDVDPLKMEFSYEGDWTEVYRWLEST